MNVPRMNGMKLDCDRTCVMSSKFRFTPEGTYARCLQVHRTTFETRASIVSMGVTDGSSGRIVHNSLQDRGRIFARDTVHGAISQEQKDPTQFAWVPSLGTNPQDATNTRPGLQANRGHASTQQSMADSIFTRQERTVKHFWNHPPENPEGVLSVN